MKEPEQTALPFVGLAPFSDFGTSLESARSIVPHLQRLEQMVLDAIARSTTGCTDWEIERETNLRHQTASARRRGLVLKGLVEDSGLRRNTDSGRAAVVWKVRQ